MAFVFFFKQKTAYEMRISDWSSDVCSSDLYSRDAYEEGYGKLGHVAFDLRSMARAAPALARHQAWRSVYGIVARFVRNEKLRQALSFHTLLVGGNPFTTSALHALAHKRERAGGVWRSEGRRVGKECDSTGSCRGSTYH